MLYVVNLQTPPPPQTSAPPPPPRPTPSAPAAQKAPAGRSAATPYAKKLAAEKGLNLQVIVGDSAECSCLNQSNLHNSFRLSKEADRAAGF